MVDEASEALRHCGGDLDLAKAALEEGSETNSKDDRKKKLLKTKNNNLDNDHQKDFHNEKKNEQKKLDNNKENLFHPKNQNGDQPSRDNDRTSSSNCMIPRKLSKIRAIDLKINKNKKRRIDLELDRLLLVAQKAKPKETNNGCTITTTTGNSSNVTNSNIQFLFLPPRIPVLPSAMTTTGGPKIVWSLQDIGVTNTTAFFEKKMKSTTKWT